MEERILTKTATYVEEKLVKWVGREIAEHIIEAVAYAIPVIGEILMIIDVALLIWDVAELIYEYRHEIWNWMKETAKKVAMLVVKTIEKVIDYILHPLNLIKDIAKGLKKMWDAFKNFFERKPGSGGSGDGNKGSDGNSSDSQTGTSDTNTGTQTGASGTETGTTTGTSGTTTGTTSGTNTGATTGTSGANTSTTVGSGTTTSTSGGTTTGTSTTATDATTTTQTDTTTTTLPAIQAGTTIDSTKSTSQITTTTSGIQQTNQSKINLEQDVQAKKIEMAVNGHNAIGFNNTKWTVTSGKRGEQITATYSGYYYDLPFTVSGFELSPTIKDNIKGYYFSYNYEFDLDGKTFYYSSNTQFIKEVNIIFN